jgi:hypothetical protein
MTASAFQFASVADHVLETDERLTDLIDVLVELGQRLDTLEALAVENAGVGGDPLVEILSRLSAFDNRLTRLERHLRRPPPFPITVVENVDSGTRRELYDLSIRLATERSERERRDSDLHNAQQGFNGSMGAFNSRLNQAAAQFCRIRERVAAVEARTADKGATP